MSDKPTRSGGGSGLATLPEWPKYPSTAVTGPEWTTYQLQVRDAALARMEALGEYVRHYYGCAHRQDREQGCTCGLSELLAACERSVAAQPSEAGRRQS